MTDRDMPVQRIAALLDDIASGLGLLTRLPVPRRAFSGARSVWVWPLIGAGLGAICAGVALMAMRCGLPVGVTAAAVMAVSAMLTGAMHEDGLADTADGLFGGWTRERRLHIMKDSHIGSYGVLALICVGLARWSALGTLIAAGAWPALIAAAALSRAPMAVIMAALPNARQGGLSASTGRPDAGRVLVGCLIAVALAVLTTHGMALWLTLAATVAASAVAITARARIGGQTGDILGASQYLAEVCVLAVAAAAVA